MTHYNYICILVLTTLKMATWVAATYRWILCNKVAFRNPRAFVGLFNKLYGKCIFFLHCQIFPFCPLTSILQPSWTRRLTAFRFRLDNQDLICCKATYLFTKWLWLAAGVLFTYVPHLMYLLPFQSGSSIVIVNCKIYSHIHILPPLSFCNNINHWSKLSLNWIELYNSRQTSKWEYSDVQHILLHV